MQIKVQTNTRELMRKFPELTRQIKFATAVALTKTAKDVQKAMPAALEKTFDRPTQFTKNGTYVQPARRDELVATLAFKDVQAKYLRLQAEGGAYNPGEAGIRLAGNIQLNTFGNIPRGLIKKLKEAADNGQLSAAVARRLGGDGDRRKSAKGEPVQLFFGVPQGRGWEGAPLGIWRRIPGAKGEPGKLIPVIVFEDTPAQYDKKLDLEAIAQPIVDAAFAGHFEQALRTAIATAK